MMREERIETDGVPGKLYDPGDAKALLLLGHGGGGSKDDERFCAMGEAAPPFADPPRMPHRRAGFAGKVNPRRHKRCARTTLLASAPGRSPLAAAGGMPGGRRGGRSALSDVAMMFGAPTVAAMPSIKAAVFGVGGIPVEARDKASWLAVAAKLEHPPSRAPSKAKPARRRRRQAGGSARGAQRPLAQNSGHVGLPAESIRQSVDFLKKYATP